MKSKYNNYYIRYYQSNDPTQTFEQFLQAIASTGLRLKQIIPREVPPYYLESGYFEYITIWEIHHTDDFPLLESQNS